MPKDRPNKKMTDEVFENVCLEIECTYEGLKTICERHGSSSTAFFNMIDNCEYKDLEGVKVNEKAERYMRARERQADYLFDLQREVSFKRDEDHTPFTGGNVVQRDRLITDTLKWQAGKLRPKVYGDKLEVEQTIKTEVPLFPDTITPKK